MAVCGLWLAIGGDAQARKTAAPITTTLATCSWDRPGVNPYRGELGAAVDRYTDIPAATRAVLKQRMAAQRYDDMAVIGRDHITGGSRYSAELRDMHFGNGRLCRSVTRKGWPAQAEERGLVYCEGAHCIIVPTVCRNVSRVTRLPAAAAARSAAERPGSSAPAVAAVPEDGELQFDAPGAGRALSASGEALPGVGPQALTLVSVDSGGAPALLLGATLPGGIGSAGSAASADPGASTAPGNLAGFEPLNLAGNGNENGNGNGPGNAAGLVNSPGSFGLGAAAPGSNTPGTGGGGLWAGPPLPLAPLQNTFAGNGGNIINSPLPLNPGATAPVPEPASAVLLLLGLAVLARRAARARRTGAGVSALG